MKSLLENINSPQDLRGLSDKQLPQLATEIREFILETLSIKPGHLGAGLGVVELSIALHYHFNTPEDLLIWDVGHQSYPHKILTGRKNKFNTLRQLDGISGFPTRDESIFDSFGTGHSSTSISAITGMAIANQLNRKNNNHIAVIGDASIVSGMALEGLNHLGNTDLNVLIILNDNSIGIDPSVGALKKHFSQIQKNDRRSIFEDFGFYYKKLANGHDFEILFKAFEELDDIKGPKLLHVKTIKGKGYEQAEKDQVKWHSPGLFNKETGEISEISNDEISFQKVFEKTIVDLMHSNQKIVAITPAMLSGSHLILAQKQFPNRVLDVGIAEQHSVTLAAGLSTQGMIPYCTIYSTFLQRAYDQVIHDVALQNLAVIFCIDRAGIVGTDGATHHGYFDIAFMNSIPNMIVSAPSDEIDFQNLLYTAQFSKSPFSIRFPRGNSGAKEITHQYEKLEIGKAYLLQKANYNIHQSNVAILSFGVITKKIQKILKEIDHSNKFSHYKFLFSKPLDTEVLDLIIEKYKIIITFEDGIENGGFGTVVSNHLLRNKFIGKFIKKTYPDEFIQHGSIEDLKKTVGFDEISISNFLKEFI